MSLLYAFGNCRNMPLGAKFFKSGNSAKMLLPCRFGFSEAEKPRALHLQATPFSLEVRWVGSWNSRAQGVRLYPGSNAGGIFVQDINLEVSAKGVRGDVRSQAGNDRTKSECSCVTQAGLQTPTFQLRRDQLLPRVDHIIESLYEPWSTLYTVPQELTWNPRIG